MNIDLNADLGEECGDDAAMFTFVSSANIACGGHAGTPRTMLESVREAARRGVAIGAHVAYPDRENFGRAPCAIAENALAEELIAQMSRLSHAARQHGADVRYVKPHGALYHAMATEPAHARALVTATQAVLGRVDLLVPHAGVVEDAAVGHNCRHEFYADRAYDEDARLVPRGTPGAVLHDVPTIVQRTLQWLDSRAVASHEGDLVHVGADSICIHGDTPAAVAIASALRSALSAAGHHIVHWDRP